MAKTKSDRLTELLIASILLEREKKILASMQSKVQKNLAKIAALRKKYEVS